MMAMLLLMMVAVMTSPRADGAACRLRAALPTVLRAALPTELLSTLPTELRAALPTELLSALRTALGELSWLASGPANGAKAGVVGLVPASHRYPGPDSLVPDAAIVPTRALPPASGRGGARFLFAARDPRRFFPNAFKKENNASRRDPGSRPGASNRGPSGVLHCGFPKKGGPYPPTLPTPPHGDG
ncbi:unnamed protein product [Lampetra fluviatilis]